MPQIQLAALYLNLYLGNEGRLRTTP